MQAHESSSEMRALSGSAAKDLGNVSSQRDCRRRSARLLSQSIPKSSRLATNKVKPAAQGDTNHRRSSRQKPIYPPSPSPSSSTFLNKTPREVEVQQTKRLRSDSLSRVQPSPKRLRTDPRLASGKAPLAGQKRKYSEGDRESSSNLFKQPREATSIGLSPNCVSKTNTLPLNQKLIAFSDNRGKRNSFIEHWILRDTWPPGMASTNNSANKRQRTSNDSQNSKSERSRSYSQSRKEGLVPEQYTAKYEIYIFTKGLDMDLLRGENGLSKKSKKDFTSLLKNKRNEIWPTVFPKNTIREVINDCQRRNEALVNREVTPLIVPSIKALFYNGHTHLKDVIDEVNTDWNKQCFLAGPQLRPDLSIGLSSSAFTDDEIAKLKSYNSVDNWTMFTENMYFPFFMCEVKCGREGLDTADRQNMHSCSVAVRALLRIEQEADKYRPRNGQTANGLGSLSGSAVVYSVSHDQKNARLHAHYAIVQGQKWTYHRHCIRQFNLFDLKDLLNVYNFVQNLFKTQVKIHVDRLKAALKLFPEPTALSFHTSEMTIEELNPQERDADGFAVPARPASSMDTAMMEQFKQQLTEQFEQLLADQRQQAKQQAEREREEAKRERQQAEREREEAEKQREEAKQQREEAEKQREEERKKDREEAEKQREEERKKDREEAEKQREEERKKDREEAEKQREEERKKDREEATKQMDLLVKQLEQQRHDIMNLLQHKA
ncbi:MAG: hypothetical protein M1814_006246 [Vezdaea aestivalis]|nr:MAG: hypothetical protein M1814_006246 [Vezdaea aestivalis]